MSLSGRALALVFGVEATYGTDPESYDTIGMIQGEPTITIDNQVVNIFAGGRIDSRAIVSGPQMVSGRFDYIVQDGNFITASIGTFDTTSPVTNTSNYIHYGCSEDSTSTETVPVEYESESYTLKFGLTATDNATVTGCKTNSITLTMGLEEPMRASVEWIGKLVANDEDTQTVVEVDAGPWMYHDKGTFKINNAAQTGLSDIVVTVNNNLKREFGALPAANERTLTALHQGPRAITGTVTLNYADDTVFDLMNASTELDIDYLLDNEAVETVVGYRGIFMDMKECRLSGLADRTHPIDGNVCKETFPFTVRHIDCKYYDATASDAFS